jgi:hypothetical protein
MQKKQKRLLPHYRKWGLSGQLLLLEQFLFVLLLALLL